MKYFFRSTETWNISTDATTARCILFYPFFDKKRGLNPDKRHNK